MWLNINDSLINSDCISKIYKCKSPILKINTPDPNKIEYDYFITIRFYASKNEDMFGYINFNSEKEMIAYYEDLKDLLNTQTPNSNKGY